VGFAPPWHATQYVVRKGRTVSVKRRLRSASVASAAAAGFQLKPVNNTMTVRAARIDMLVSGRQDLFYTCMGLNVSGEVGEILAILMDGVECGAMPVFFTPAKR